MSCPLKDAARDVPHFPALVTQNKILSFSELDQLADLQAKQLSLQGIGPGDRIAVCHLSKEKLISLFFSAWRIGACICPINQRLPPPQIEQALLRLQPKLFVDTQQFFSSTPSTPSSLFLFTSGSTAVPKIAILSLQNLIANAYFSLEALSFAPKDRWLLSLPLYHVGGIGILFRAILGRGTIALDDKDPNITHLSNVPTQLYRAWPTYPHLKCLLLGGGPIGAVPKQLPAIASYGLTEMASIVLAGEKCLPGRELRIAQDREIWVRGKCLFQGYWKEKNPLDEEGWFPTGDVWSSSGIGRKDWMFISGGENIQPEEIERCLLEMPGVYEAAVLPSPDPEFGKRPIAILSTKCAETQILSFLSKRLPKYKIPIAFHKIDELPKKGLKVDRNLLAKIFC